MRPVPREGTPRRRRCRTTCAGSTSALESSSGPEGCEEASMCRNIRTLHNFAPPATVEEIRASSLQFVRKLSGFTRPSKANELAFGRAVDEVTRAAHQLLASLVTSAPPRDREVEA